MAGAWRGGACGVGSARNQAVRGSRPRPDRKGQSPAARPQGRLPAARPHGATPRPWLSPIRAAALIGAVPAQGGTARPRGATRGQQRLLQGRRAAPSPAQGSDDGDGEVRVREEG
ncbi:hypothetical protein GW17_00046392 [Ensete ventricosum]|nr:hypothetical protein GW17_00046392 [Ensete ventricosum]